MKRTLIMLFIGMLTISLFSGCQNTGSHNAPVSGPGVSDTEDTRMDVPPVPAIEDTILANKEAWRDNANLYEINLPELEGACQSALNRFGNDLLLTYTQLDPSTHVGTFYIKLLSLETGEVLHEQQLGSLVFGEIQILDGYIAVNDLGDGKCYLLDETLQLVDTYELPGGTFCLNPAGDTAYQFTYNQGIRKVDLATGEKTVLLDNAVNLYMYEATGRQATFVFVDRDTLLRGCGILDLKTEEITWLDSPYAYSGLEIGGDTWLGKVDGEDPLYVISDGENQNQFYVDLSDMVILGHDSGQVIICQSPENKDATISAYDIQGNLISACQATGYANSFPQNYVWYEEYQGYFFTLMDEKEQDCLLFWDVSTDSEGVGLSLEDVEKIWALPSGSAVSQKYYDRAKALSDKYDVQILIADQCDTQFVDHTGELLLSEREIDLALSTIDQVMGMYPDGFFTQLKHNTYGEIEIQILGVLEKDYSTEEVKYISGGFVTASYPGKILMALDARGDMEGDFNGILAETMYHEFSHIIDKRLDFDSQLREDSAYTASGWLQLNPEGFEYNDTYYGTLDPKYNDYFIDAYACTNATEDRARIMEYAMDGDVYPFEAKAGLHKKLEYYCNGIRDSFDTTGWPEETPWEKTLHSVR